MTQVIFLTYVKISTHSNFTDPRHPRQNFTDPRQNFMDPRQACHFLTHAKIWWIHATHAKILQTHATHAKVWPTPPTPPTRLRYPRHPRFLADSFLKHYSVHLIYYLIFSVKADLSRFLKKENNPTYGYWWNTLKDHVISWEHCWIIH